MRLFINEFLKVWGKKSVLFIFLGVAVLNSVILLIRENPINDVTYSPSDYTAIYADISTLSNEEALEKLMLESPDLDLASEKKLKYTDNAWTEFLLYSDVIAEVEACINYHDYLQNIDEAAAKMQTVTIFSDPDSFAYKNIIKTPKDYAELKNNLLKADVSKGVKLVIEPLTTEIFALILIVFIIILSITREKELSQFGLIKSTYKGRFHLIGAKLCTVFFSCLIIVVLLYGANIATAGLLYGFGDMDRLIQSVYGYRSCNLNISVMQFILYFLLTKLLTYLLFASIIFLMSVSTQNSVELYVLIAAFLGVESILYFTIPSTSYICLLKYINPISFLQTHKMLGNYLNLNIFGKPVNYISTFFVFVTFLILLFSVLSIVLFCKRRYNSKIRILGFIDIISTKINQIKTYKTTSVFVHECHKILINWKVLPMILVFIGITTYLYKPMNERFYDMSDVYYKKYMTMLEGELSDEKEDFLLDEIDRIRNDFSSKSSDLQQQQTALNRALEHMEYLKGTENGWFLYDAGYKLLTGSDRSNDLHLAILASAVLVACMLCVYGAEYQNNIIVLVKTTMNGRSNIFFKKILISTFVLFSIFIITYAPYFYNVLTTYGTNALSAPANSIEILSKIPSNISILGYLIIISLMRFIGLFLAMLTIFLISVKLKSYITSALASIAIIVAPLVISLIGIEVFDYFLFNPFIIGNVFR